jgi:hypothetical protein
MNLDFRIDFWHSLAIAPKSTGGHLSDFTSDPGQPQKLAIVYPDLASGFSLTNSYAGKLAGIQLLKFFVLYLDKENTTRSTRNQCCKLIQSRLSFWFTLIVLQMIDFSFLF